MEQKQTSIQVKTGAGLAEGEFIAYPSTFTRTPDSYGDVMAKGAFTKTIAEWKSSGNVLPVLYGHNIDDPDMNIGAVIDQGEDDHGWWIKGRFDIDDPKGKKVWGLVKGRRLTTLSFAYDVLDKATIKLKDGSTARELREVRVYEASFTPNPANPDTSVVGVKSAEDAKFEAGLAAADAAIAEWKRRRSLPPTLRLAAKQANYELEKTMTQDRKNVHPNSPLGQRERAFKAAQAILDKAEAEGRELTADEAAEVEAKHAEVRDANEWIAHINKLEPIKEALDALGAPRRAGEATQGGVARLNFKGLSTRMAAGMSSYSRRVGLTKGLAPAGESVIAIMPEEVAPFPSIEGERPPRLLDSLPSSPRSAAYSFLRQTVVSNPGAAGVVAPGELKPTKKLGVRRVDDRLRVVAVLSEPTDRFLLEDEVSLTTWVAGELADAILTALEEEILTGDGTGEHFTGLAHTVGVQTQEFAVDPLVTVQHGLSKMQALGIAPSVVALSAADWLAIQTTRNASGGFDVGGPVDSTAQTAWGTRVVVVPGLAAGSGWIIGDQTVVLSYDGDAALRTDWGRPGDAFSRNEVVARVEGRFNLDVLRPHGIVQLDMTAGA